MTTKQALRVLVVTPRYFPLMGGVETHVYEVGRRLVSAGLDLTVLTTNPGGRWPVQEILDGIKVRRVRSYPAKKDFYFSPGLYREITSNHWDLIHFQGVHTLVPALGMLAARRAGLPYLLTFHTGGHSESWRRNVRQTQWRVLRPLLSQANRLVGVSHFEVNYFQKLLNLSADRFVVIPNGGTLPLLTHPTEFLEQNHPATSRPLIVSVGRLERYKGHQRAIEALPGLLGAYPRARLLIVGSGPYESSLRALATRLGVAQHVEIRSIPANERHKMAALLSQADLMVLFSEYEAHPVSVMEALSLGRPVLVADTSGLSELAERRLVRAIPLDSSPAQTARAIMHQLANPLNPSETIGLPTWEDCAANLLDLYEEVAARKGVLACA